MENNDNSPIHFLYPSNIYVSKEPYLINTILGSCVAVCLYDPILQAGGMNHYMLPYWNGEGLASPKHGNIAIEKLLDKMIEFGSSKHHLKAKIFGGGEVLQSNFNHYNIGERNIQVAETMLEQLRIPIVSASVGGQKGRKIQFNTYTGTVRQKYVNRQSCHVGNIENIKRQ